MGLFIIIVIIIFIGSIIILSQTGKRGNRNRTAYQLEISKSQPLEFEIAGLYYRSTEAHKLARNLTVGTFLDFELEPDNDHDKYAIKIMYNDIHIGYIPSHYSKPIFPLLQQGGKCVIEVARNDNSEIPHVWVKLYPVDGI